MRDKTGIFIQSRMGSSRFPGKSMAVIDGKSLLQHLLEAIMTQFDKQQIWVLTSADINNQPIIDLCEEIGVNYFRGDEHNVASRFKIVLEQTKFDYFFRICGDSPFFSPQLILKAVDEVSKNNSLEVVTSLPNKGNPQGQNIELISTKTFLETYPLFKEKAHFEHVTNFFYTNLDQFQSLLLTCDYPGYEYSDYKFSVDTKEDLELIKKMYTQLSQHPYLYELNDLMSLMNTIKNNY